MEQFEFRGTKGEWLFKPLEYLGSITCEKYEVYSEGNEHWICIVQKKGIIEEKEGKANAQLIAHAPQMFEMLNKFLEIDLFDLERGEPTESYYQYCEQAKQLLKSATNI